LTGAETEEQVEESTVPRQANRDRLVQRVAAAAAEVPDRVVALAALAADEVARVPAGRRFHRARRLAWAGNRRRDGCRPAGHRLVRLGGDRRCGSGSGGGRHAGGNGGRCRGGGGRGRGGGGVRWGRGG